MADPDFAGEGAGANFKGGLEKLLLVSTYIVCERLSVMHKQVCVQLTSNSKFLSKFSRKGLLGISDQKAPPPISENFRFEMTKVYSKISPLFGKLQI